MKRIAGWLVAVVVALGFLLPLLWMLHASFRPESAIFTGGLKSLFDFRGLHLEHYVAAWRRAAMGIGLLNSLLQVAGILGLGLLFNSMAAFALARFDFPGRAGLFALVIVLIILPVEVLVVPLLLTVRDLGLVGGHGRTLAALVLPFAVKAFNIYFLRQHFLALPRDLEEAAIMDGAGPFRIYWSVGLPAIRPALATVLVLDMLTHWSDFIWPLVICTREETRTVQIALSNLFTQPPIQWGDILACAVMTTLPVLVVFRLAQRHIVASQLTAGIK
ncbi:MAG: carbohydrate ABC transporter permease [Kiritimatiellae bacterium]|jgi:multiple sugar transport system permease protein/fructooligosaccharide transport system permease protein|nr:carbohydrate ABC transporter permease [Kiritimatiellia bacterium]MDD4340717.1 carbohydrate ABC transporter permease [Kiritimatiellia bacterium]MDY0149741.1 carbohydrate ABC transporter permease [Kiritimatiellia bacterium]